MPNRLYSVCAILLCWLSIGCASAVDVKSPGDTPAAASQPLPIKSFFQRSKYGGGEISPSGQYMAIITPVNDRQNAAVIDLEAGKIAAITAFTDGDAITVLWQSDDRLIVYDGDLHQGTGDGPSVWGITAVNRDGSNPRPIMKSYGAGPRSATGGFDITEGPSILQLIPNSNDIYVQAFDRTGYSADLYRLDTVTGKKTWLSFQSPGHVARWVLDFDGVPRAAVTADVEADKSALYVRKDATSPWQKISETALARESPEPMIFSPDGKILYINARRNGDRGAIYEYDIEAGTWNGPTVKHPERDVVARFAASLKQRKLLQLWYVDDQPSVVSLNPEWARIQKSVDATLPDTVNHLGKARDADVWTVIAASDRNPGDLYLLDGKTMKMKKLLSYRPWIDPAQMASSRWVRYKARDGLTIPAMLTVPAAAKGKPAPLIVDIHGGPNVEATGWGYDPEVQFLASRGYAVLQPQYRGTDGFGWKLFSAGFRKWGDEMQDDLEDGVKWAVAQGIADPDRVCFYGASYGGYAAMWGAIKNAKLIKCSVAYVGVSSIDYLFDNTQANTSELVERSSYVIEQIGDPKTERARFKRVSPLYHADQVGVPILLAYGALDTTVPPVHGWDFRAALDRYGKKYEWVIYEHEDHGFAKEENVLDFYGRVERFLAKYLAPSAVPAKTP